MVKIKEHTLASGTEIFIGRDAESNDVLVREAKPNDILIHTVAPGSPFVNVKVNPMSGDIIASGAICVACSQDWRDNKRATEVNIFKKKDMNKEAKMKAGTWSVKNQKKKKIKKVDILKAEKEIKNETN